MLARWWTVAVCASLLGSLAHLAHAQDVGFRDAVRGTWSGDWVLASEARDRVTVEFSWDGDILTGKMLNPDQIDLSRVEFDESAGTVVAEAVDPETTTSYRIEARVEGTRLNGTMILGNRNGDLRLTKWTYVPRPRF
jgi:hypothetical protein